MNTEVYFFLNILINWLNKQKYVYIKKDGQNKISISVVTLGENGVNSLKNRWLNLFKKYGLTLFIAYWKMGAETLLANKIRGKRVKENRDRMQ